MYRRMSLAQVSEVENNREDILNDFQARLLAESNNYQIRRRWQQQNLPATQPRNAIEVSRELWELFRREIGRLSPVRRAMMLILITLLTLTIGFIGLLTSRSLSGTENNASKKEEHQSGSATDQSHFRMGF